MWIRLFTFKGNLDLIFSRFCVRVNNCKNVFWSWSSIELACCRQQGNKLQSNPCGHFHPIKIHPRKCPDCYTSVWHHYGKGPYWHRPFFFKENDNFCFRFLPKPPDTHWLKTVLKMLNTGTISKSVVPIGHMDTKTWENMVQIKKYQSYTLRPLFPFDSIWFRYITMNIRPAFRSVTLQIYQNNLRICLLQLSTLKLLVSVFVSPVHTDREEISS